MSDLDRRWLGDFLTLARAADSSARPAFLAGLGRTTRLGARLWAFVDFLGLRLDEGRGEQFFVSGVEVVLNGVEEPVVDV